MSSSNNNILACGLSYTSPSGNHVWTTSGTYHDTIPNHAGCDSLLTIVLTLNTVNTSVTTYLSTITAVATGATYQWLNCDFGYAVIPGQVYQNFIATVDGNYAVEVTQNGCVDTSVCVNIQHAAIAENSLFNDIVISPNPVVNILKIGNLQKADIEISNIKGQIVKRISTNETNTTLDISAYASGMYYIKVKTEKGIAVKKFIKE